MLHPFRSEIRNSPNEQTIKIYLSDESLDNRIKHHLENFTEIDHIEINESVEQNRAHEGLTVFINENVDINRIKATIDSSLWWYFEKELVE
ncbi:hypothetical protein ACFQ0I_01785 [Mariniflexile aquimaris]|uniref:Uncharacterized protein n=1 Tax=Mariniflexile aquimaris TaxID=881009 RepID=A0ABW3BN25_9FLAO